MHSKFVNATFIAASLVGLSHTAKAEITLPSLADGLTLTPQQQLGKKIFFDTNLSSPPGQACAGCHDPKIAFTDARLDGPVSLGVVTGRTGTRNAPSASYAAFAPQFHFDQEEGLYVGGQFLDGRAADLLEQAKGPFLNPDEMNNTDAQSVVDKIQVSEYADLFKQVFGASVFDNSDGAYDNMAQAIAAYENTAGFNRFTSKYDYYLKGRVGLTELEQLGLDLFEDENKANCAACHISRNEDSSVPLFTDFTYDNLGVPANPAIQAEKGDDFVDLGLGQTVNDPAENGKFKVPSLRNVAKTAPYMHNGVFTELKEVVDFYNTRDTDGKWPEAEVAENVNHDELGDLKLSDAEVDAIVAFLRTLTDGYAPETIGQISAQGLIELPYVRLESAGEPDRFFAVTLQQREDGLFESTQLEQVEPDDFSLLQTMPYFSFDSGLLELPWLQLADADAPSYTAQLKYRGMENGRVVFELLYVKAW